MFKSYDIFWQDKVIFEYRRLLDRGDHMGRFDYKFNNNGDIHPSVHGRVGSITSAYIGELVRVNLRTLYMYIFCFTLY
jgi:hypothetical protein